MFCLPSPTTCLNTNCTSNLQELALNPTDGLRDSQGQLLCKSLQVFLLLCPHCLDRLQRENRGRRLFLMSPTHCALGPSPTGSPDIELALYEAL